MILDNVLIFLRGGCEDFTEKQIKYWLDVAKAEHSGEKILELHLRIVKSKMIYNAFTESKPKILPTAY